MNSALTFQSNHQMNEVQQNVFNHIPSLVWLLSDQGDAYFFNKVSQEYIGINEFQKFQNNWMDLLHFEDIAVFQKEWRQAFATKAPFQVECRLRHQSGAYRWFLLSAKFVEADQSGQAHWFINSVDIHETKQYQHNLVQCINAQTNMLDNSVDCIKLLDLDGYLLHVNRTGCIALNIPENNHRFGMKWTELLAPEIRSKANYALKMVLKGKTARFEA